MKPDKKIVCSEFDEFFLAYVSDGSKKIIQHTFTRNQSRYRSKKNDYSDLDYFFLICIRVRRILEKYLLKNSAYNNSFSSYKLRLRKPLVFMDEFSTPSPGTAPSTGPGYFWIKSR